MEVKNPTAGTGERYRSDRLEQLAQRIVERRLEAPLLFLLEAHLPLQGLLYHGGLLAAPFLRPLLGSELLANFEALLSDRRHIEELIERIEQGALARDQATPEHHP